MAKAQWVELLTVAVTVLVLMMISLLPRLGLARDGPQWANMDPAIQDEVTTRWMSQLLQPSTIVSTANGITGTSCCGKADAYWVEAHARQNWQNGEEIVAVITDDRPDEPFGRQHEEVGTQYIVPPGTIVGEKQRIGNPSGHSVIFLGAVSLVTPGGALTSERSKPRPVLCFVDNSGS